MNYSRPMSKTRIKRLRVAFISVLIIGIVIGLIAGYVIGRAVSKNFTDEVHTFEVEVSKVNHDEPAAPNLTPATIPNVTPEPISEPAPELLGEYRITAYCPCEKCCGEWAKNRPDGVVYGAAGVELTPGLSIASTLPFGTIVEIEGLGEYTVQDRTAKWVVEKYGENLIDVYFTDHSAACEFGLKYLNVYLKEEVTNDQMQK